MADSASETAGALPRIHRDTLVEVNRAFFTARRSAAHGQVVTILRQELLAATKERRAELYRICLNSLADAVTATERSQIQQDSPVLHYLRLLRETVSANLALVEHEMSLINEAAAFSRTVGADTIAELVAAGDVFSRSEMSILDCIEGLLKFGEQVMARDTADRLPLLDADETRRYELALRKYREFYQEAVSADASAQGCEP